MMTENSIVMKAPLDRVFETAADLSRWPDFLPHYRWVTYLEKSPSKNVVRMAAKRGWIPVSWTSEQVIDLEKREVHFHHLKSFTRGMHVVWTFRAEKDSVRVGIRHDMQPNIPLVGGFIADKIIGRFFIHYVANQTLRHMKLHVEGARGE
jgi:ribosome-associated toxin RatA of RatAB toxin-antitoxin module